MKETMTWTQCLEKMGGLVLPTTALIWALSLLSPTEWLAQNVSSTDEGAKVTEVTQQWTRASEEKKTIKLEDAVQTLEDDDPRVQVHWFVEIWSNVAPDMVERLSDKPAMWLFIDATDKKTWLWVSVARKDDFCNNPEYPASQATVLNAHQRKTFWKDWRASVTAEWKYTLIDKLPSANGLTWDIVWSYTTENWLTGELTYFHWFKKGKDTNTVRVWVTKRIGETLSITWQVWASDTNPNFFWHVKGSVKKNWWSWYFGAIGKGGKVTPVGWFQRTF